MCVLGTLTTDQKENHFLLLLILQYLNKKKTNRLNIMENRIRFLFFFVSNLSSFFSIFKFKLIQTSYNYVHVIKIEREREKKK